MTGQVVIRTGARLHFGLLSDQPDRERRFGGAGLMIDTPGFQLVARRAECHSIEITCDTADDATAAHDIHVRCEEFRERFLERCAAGARSNGFRIEVRRAIPSHHGLGSGTQFALAVAKALSLLMGEDETDAVALANRVERGARSAMGIHGFERGGFLIDGGKHSETEIGQLAAHAPFPAEWRMLLVTPVVAKGLSGEAERTAFNKLPPMSHSMVDRLSGLLRNELLPAVVNARFDACGDSLYDFGRAVGEYFAPIQGGVYACRQMSELVGHLRFLGIRGVGQTSWGPSIFVLMPDSETANALIVDLEADDRFFDCRFQVARAMNHGAEVLMH